MSFGFTDEPLKQKRADQKPRKKPETLADTWNGDVVRLEFAGVVVQIMDSDRMTDGKRKRSRGNAIWCRFGKQAEYVEGFGWSQERFALPANWKCEAIELAK